ncbi:zinc-binding dehydrogenase [Rhodococcus sp. NCIMB 12038]|uniref:zinc-binding dehydrogenase n=1 Tax=Rhodococcus sp. NCIMB 12038 TaxID=933800 RepID=UPI00277D1552|nr:zinc-binding dehydrogenase [Rhodococcus sp. NCIMB 12038]
MWGVGGVGTHIVQLARLVGAVPVIAFDINPAVRERALELGADYAFDSRDEDLKEKVAEATGRMLDVAFDASGLKVTFEQALDCLTVGGRLVAVGLSTVDVVTEGQMLHRKAARLTRLAATAPPEVRTRLEEKIAVLDEHREAVGVKRGKINRELAFHFARQVTDYATAAGAQVIAVEDLTTLEARGHGRVNNNRAAQSARRKAVAALAHTAAGVGVTVVSVSARGSSALCPGCDAPLARPGGYHSAWCSGCGVGGNRDHIAGVNLAKRALLGRTKVTRRRGQMPAIGVAEHAPVRKSREKTSPTPSRPRHRRVRRSLPTATPRAGVTPNRYVPAPRASVWDTVEPAPPHGDAGSRDTRPSPPPATQVADSMRST